MQGVRHMSDTARQGIRLSHCAAALPIMVDRLAESYFSAKTEAEKAVRQSAVGELAEKRLNRELKLKNYLADKNARLEERETISRNIHNSVGHSITAAVMTLDAADCRGCK